MPVQMATTTVPELSTGSVIPTALRGVFPAPGVRTPTTDPPVEAHFRTYRIVLDNGWNSESEQEVRDLCAGAIVGDRVTISGEEREVYLATACLKEHGFGDDEITVECTSSGNPFSERAQRRVTCCHCKEVFGSTFQVGDDVECPSCGRALNVYYHYNRRSCSYLGFVLAEEVDR